MGPYFACFSLTSDVTNGKCLRGRRVQGAAYREISRVPVGHHAPARGLLSNIFPCTNLCKTDFDLWCY